MTSVLCFVCHSGTGKIITFTRDTFEKSVDILGRRKALKYKYSDLNLPLTSFSDSGYHIECYCKFTAISQALFAVFIIFEAAQV